MASYKKAITLDATLQNMDRVLNMVEEGLTCAECPQKIVRQILVCVEEVFVNVANYAYKDVVGSCTVRCEVEDVLPDKGNCVIEVKDGGVAFNPLSKEDPDITLSAMDRKIGGLGIYMVKKTMDQVTYQYEDGNNILTMIKSFEK